MRFGAGSSSSWRVAVDPSGVTLQQPHARIIACWHCNYVWGGRDRSRGRGREGRLPIGYIIIRSNCTTFSFDESRWQAPALASAVAATHHSDVTIWWCIIVHGVALCAASAPAARVCWPWRPH